MLEFLAWTSLVLALLVVIAIVVTFLIFRKNPVRMAPSLYISGESAFVDTVRGGGEYGGAEPGWVFAIFSVGIMMLTAISLAYNAQDRAR
jgi:hypothetical protein